MVSRRPSIETRRPPPRCHNAYSPQSNQVAILPRTFESMSACPATRSGLQSPAIGMQRASRVLTAPEITAKARRAAANPRSADREGGSNEKGTLNLVARTEGRINTAAATTQSGAVRATRNAEYASMATMASRSSGGRGLETAHTMPPPPNNNQGTQTSTGSARSGRHPAMPRDRRTVPARNAHICQPYGFTSVASALSRATPAINARGACDRHIWTLVQTTSRPAPTIQPPCRLTHTANNDGRATIHHGRGAVINRRQIKATPIKVQSWGRNVLVRYAVPHATRKRTGPTTSGEALA